MVVSKRTIINPTIPSDGIEFVFVNGVLVVDDGELVSNARSGRPIRAH